MKVHIIDNFLPEEEFNQIKNFITGKTIPWYHGQVIEENIPNISSIDCTTEENYQFSHIFYIDDQAAPFIGSISPLVDGIIQVGCRSLVRIKANLTLKTDEIIEHGFHVDYQDFDGGKTAIYYVNTNNGYTKFESGDTVDSLENRLVVFDGTMLHTGTTCTDKIGRYVINFDFF
jgi:hypothetical protein